MTPRWVPQIPHAARSAYAYADMDQPCPNCSAEPHEFCRAGHGHPRRVPCVARITKLPDPTDPDPDRGSATDQHTAAGNHREEMS
jgi:hypothetical protein